MNASHAHYLVVFATAAAALPGLPHPVRAAELPSIALVREAQQVTSRAKVGHPFGNPLRRMSRVRFQEEQKRRDMSAKLKRAPDDRSTA